MTQTENRARLDQLLSYLEHDPANGALLRDAAQAAMAADDLEQAKDLFARLKDTGGLTDPDSNLWAVAAMRSGEPQLAAETFAGLLAAEPGNAALQFNLAWAKASAKDEVGARELLSEALVEELPQAALLEVQLMHSAGEFDDAVVRAKSHLERHGDYPPLLAALSVLALDVEDEELARDCAEKASGHPDGLTTLATLALSGDQPQRARAMFEQSLALNANSPRAWVGLGLSDLLSGDGIAAGASLDKGAGLFGDHLGSWIAAGWAYLIAGDLAKARERFEHSLELDDTFSEGHGSLAVVDALLGDREAAERNRDVALRLDRQCLSAMFATVLLSAADGDTEKGQRLMEIALRQPMGENGRTLADMIARMAR